MPRHLLAVDDESAITSMLKAMLEAHGYTVSTAGSASEAQAALQREHFHLVLTDMKMESDTAGYDVVRAAKAQPYRPAVVILTAFPMLAQNWQGAGADAVLPKPVSFDRLLELLNRLSDATPAR